jgi:hypothetical protein
MHVRICMVRRKRILKLNKFQDYNIIYLWRHRLVVPRATGQTITRITAEVKNRTKRQFGATIPVGTYFIASSRHQNMVTYKAQRVRLDGRATARISIPAACINASRPIPGRHDKFKGVATVSKELTRFLQRASTEEPMVIQAGVWAVTDRYTKRDIQQRLISGAAPAISDHQIMRAKSILEELNLPTRL